MRLSRLDLDRYGPFAGTTLEFRPDAALHIVYGRNEAGKSSALAAITDLLYGFELRSPANFRHRYEDLRIGADMIRADGGTFSFWRRKRNKNSLTGLADAPLDEALLDPMLAGISREVFMAAFGLNQSGLREGARQMLAAQGEVGESLFAAASGLKTLISVRAGLDQEADALFGPRKSAKRAFYEAQERYDTARRMLRERSLRADDVRDLEERITAQEAAVGVLAQRLKEAGERRSRIDRVRRVGPLLARIARGEQGLQALAGVPELPAEFASRIETALADAQAGRESLARLAREVAQGREALGAIVVDDALLADADAITDLNDERAVLAKALQDLPRRQDEARDVAATLEDLARRLGLPDRAALGGLRPNDMMLERIRDLVERRRAAETTAAESEKAARRAKEAIENLARQVEARSASADPEPLRRRLQAIRPALSEADIVRDREADLARRRAQFEERLARLSPAVPATQALWTWPDPSEDVLSDFEQRFAGFENASRRDEAEITRLEEGIADSDRIVAELAGDDELVDAAMLARQRETRDALLESLIPVPEPALVDTYRKAVSWADELADRRLGQAERLARHAMALRARRDSVSLLEKLRSGKMARAEEERQVQIAWQAVFAPLGCVAERPASMRRFLGDVARTREERNALSDMEAAVERSARRLAEERPALEAIAREVGLAGTAVQSLGSLLRLIEDRLDALEQGAREGRSLDDRLAAGRTELARAEQEAREAQAVLVAMQVDWSTITVAIGLGGQASVQEVAKATELWAGVRGKLSQLESLDHRVASILEDRDAFAVRVDGLVRRLMPGETGEARHLSTMLMERLAAGRDADARRRAAAELLARHRAALDQAEASQRESETAVMALAREAGCDPSGLAALAADLAGRAALHEELKAARNELALQGDGIDEKALNEEAAGIGTDRAAGEIEAVQSELAALAEEDKQAALILGDLRRQRAAVEQEAGAAGAAQQLQDARSDLERIARDYIVLRAASLLIETGLERQLRADQGPLIANAGKLFSTITEDAFAGIITRYDEEDRLRLAARRRDEGIVEIDQLSEGTRDQLYLALRLANLEAMAARRQVPPFIGDDLVITFDEPRVAATLSVLAARDSSLQKILFTHHRHVVDIARDRLGIAADIIALGD